jgi:hypothetical protein
LRHGSDAAKPQKHGISALLVDVAVAVCPESHVIEGSDHKAIRFLHKTLCGSLKLKPARQQVLELCLLLLCTNCGRFGT